MRDDHAHDTIAGAQRNAFHATRVAAHRAGVGFRKADGHAVGCAEDNVAAGVDLDDVDQFVVSAAKPIGIAGNLSIVFLVTMN